MARRIGGVINYKIVGDGINVVFLHGWGGNASAFLFVAERLKSFCRSIVVDFNGFGDTPEPDRPYSVGDYAGEVLSLLEKEGVKKAIIVGHSFGGRVALEIAGKFPDAVSGLVLVDSAGLKPRRKPSYYVKILLHKFLKKLGFRGLQGSRDYRVLSFIMKETFKKVVSYDQTYLLENINTPTLILWGKNDKETPLYMANKLEKKIKDSKLILLEGGHYAYVEDLANFVKILSAFVKGVGVC